MYNAIFGSLILTVVYSIEYKSKPHVISSPKFVTDHLSAGFHVECPERIQECQIMAKTLESAGIISYSEPSSYMKERALQQIKKVFFVIGSFT